MVNISSSGSARLSRSPGAWCIPSKASSKWVYFWSRARGAARIAPSPLPSRHLRLPSPRAVRHGLLPSLNMAPGRSLPRCPASTLPALPSANMAPTLPPPPAALIKQGGSSSVSIVPALCALPRWLQRLQLARRKDGGSDCGRLNSREAAKSAHKGAGSCGSCAADPWIRCQGRT